MELNDEEIVNEVSAYANFIRKVAFTAVTSSSAIGVDDLCQVGSMAVIRGLRSYDPTRGGNIKSYIFNCVRQDIHNEAARFLGVFTVDHRITEMGAKINKLSDEGKTDDQIRDILNKKYSGRFWTTERVRDVKSAYNFRCPVLVDMDHEDYSSTPRVDQFLESIIKNDTDRKILCDRILGTKTAKKVADEMSITTKKLYALESDLKKRIRIAVEER